MTKNNQHLARAVVLCFTSAALVQEKARSEQSSCQQNTPLIRPTNIWLESSTLLNYNPDIKHYLAWFSTHRLTFILTQHAFGLLLAPRAQFGCHISIHNAVG